MRLVHAPLIEQSQVEHVVVQAHDLPACGMQVTAAGHAVPLLRGGAVERLRGAGTPVDEQLVVVLAAQADPADIEPLIGLEVQAAEAQVPFRGLEFPAPVDELLGEHLALGPSLVVLHRRAEAHLGEPPGIGGPHRVQPLVQHRDVRLLLCQLGRGLADGAFFRRHAVSPVSAVHI